MGVCGCVLVCVGVCWCVLVCVLVCVFVRVLVCVAESFYMSVYVLGRLGACVSALS